MLKSLRLPDYNYDFDTKTGLFARWGKTKDEDPQFSPIGPEIADIEVTTSCCGAGGQLCKFCYKSNNPDGKNMSFDTFKTIFDKLPKNLMQIAFGADASGEANPDLFRMMEYCRENNVVPNITVADISAHTAMKLAKLCGAVAVSHYDTNICKRSIDLLYRGGLQQINIHQMVSEETLENCYNIMDEAKNIPGLKAIVMLSLKKKGRGKYFNPLPYYLFSDLVDYAMQNKVPLGFDSCTAHKFLKYVDNSGNPDLQKMAVFVEPCESMLFSTYIDVDGMVYPCSFTPGSAGWDTGLDAVKCEDYINDIWNHERMIQWRQNLIAKDRVCPLYHI